MNPTDGRAMFELQLELHALAVGLKPPISADELLEVHETLDEHAGDFKTLLKKSA